MNSTQQNIPLAKAGAIIPGNPHPSTLFRWALKGCRGVRLRTYLCGSRRFTTEVFIQQFLDASTAAAEGRTIEAMVISEPTATSIDNHREQDRIANELDRIGIRARTDETKGGTR